MICRNEKKLMEKKGSWMNRICIVHTATVISYILKSDSGENCIKLQLLMQLAQEQVQSPKVWVASETKHEKFPSSNFLYTLYYVLLHSTALYHLLSFLRVFFFIICSTTKYSTFVKLPTVCKNFELKFFTPWVVL